MGLKGGYSSGGRGNSFRSLRGLHRSWLFRTGSGSHVFKTEEGKKMQEDFF